MIEKQEKLKAPLVFDVFITLYQNNVIRKAHLDEELEQPEKNGQRVLLHEL
jgi:hypothetical protein